MTIDALTLDLDGTLIDTAGEIAVTVNLTLAEFGLPPRPLAEISARIGHGLHALMIGLLQQMQADDPRLVGRLLADRVLPVLDRHDAAIVGSVARPYPGALEALDALAGEGVRLGCVTNKAGASARRLLERCGLAPRLSLLVAGDTLAQRKPDGAVLRHAAEALGVPVARLAHVGDSRTDVQAARNAGAVAWAVPYGYDGGEPVAQARPDALFPTLPALAAHLIALRRAERAERAECRGDGHADAGR